MEIRFTDEAQEFQCVSGQAFYVVDMNNNIVFSGIGNELCIENMTGIESYDYNTNTNVLIIKLPFTHFFITKPVNVYDWLSL